MAHGVALLAFNVFGNRTIIGHVVGAATSVALPFHYRPSFLLCVTQALSVSTIIVVIIIIPTLPVLLLAHSCCCSS